MRAQGGDSDSSAFFVVDEGAVVLRLTSASGHVMGGDGQAGSCTRPSSSSCTTRRR